MKTIRYPGQIGSLLRRQNFPSAYTQARPVDVWLPPGYAENPSARYPVLYMHDGQNLFDTRLSYGKVPWGIDRAAGRLMAEGKTRGLIVVGPWNTEKRWADYLPQQAVEGLTDPILLEKMRLKLGGGLVRSDAYLHFLVDEVKPWVDASFRTLPDPDNTSVMGSSMGGLISLYAICRCPQVFGGAGCVSTHWPAAPQYLLPYFKDALPTPGDHRIYFDYGTETLDSEYEPYQQQMDGYMIAAGYRRQVDWLTLKFEGEEHSEKSWSKRVHIPLEFLLKDPPA